MFCGPCLMTEVVSKNNSLQEVCEVFCQCLYDLSSKMGVPITGDRRKCILTIFFHCEILTLLPGKALSYQIKVRFAREPGKAKRPSWTSHSSDCLVYSHFLFILNFLMRGYFCRSRMGFVYVCHSFHRSL